MTKSKNAIRDATQSQMLIYVTGFHKSKLNYDSQLHIAYRFVLGIWYIDRKVSIKS